LHAHDRDRPDDSDCSTGPTPRVQAFLETRRPETPCLVVDLAVVARRYHELAAALPGVDLYYAVKANPAPPILGLLGGLGCWFDVASPAEIDACLAAGVEPWRISYGNTVKKEADVARAHELGVPLYTVDCGAELDKVLRAAPGTVVTIRLRTDGIGADWPLSKKFGCGATDAVALATRAAEAGSTPGLSFHVGSQQRNLDAWDAALTAVADVVAELDRRSVPIGLVNLGGGFPGSYREEVPPIGAYGDAIRAAVDRRLGDRPVRLLAEPGRHLVADAGVLHTEVVLVAERADEPDRRWVYLDIGLFGGLAESLGEAIRYRIRTPHDGTPTGRVALAGPTCDSTDVLYEHTDYRLPLALRAGDRVELLATGAYTTSYSSVGFNGFAPLGAHYLPGAEHHPTTPPADSINRPRPAADPAPTNALEAAR
jgi:ornithine decarboxylase